MLKLFDPARRALRSIAEGEPDAKLTDAEEKALPKLRRRGWVRVCRCSDGDYVEVTEKGRAVLEGKKR